MIWESRDTEKKIFQFYKEKWTLAGIKQEADLKHLLQTEREITVGKWFYGFTPPFLPPRPLQKRIWRGRSVC